MTEAGRRGIARGAVAVMTKEVTAFEPSSLQARSMDPGLGGMVAAQARCCHTHHPDTACVG